MLHLNPQNSEGCFHSYSWVQRKVLFPKLNEDSKPAEVLVTLRICPQVQTGKDKRYIMIPYSSLLEIKEKRVL